MNKKHYRCTKIILKIMVVLACLTLISDIYVSLMFSALFYSGGIYHLLRHIWLPELPIFLLWLFVIWASFKNKLYVLLIFPVLAFIYLPQEIWAIKIYWHVHSLFYLPPKLLAWFSVSLFCVAIIGLVTMLCEYYRIRKYSTTGIN